MALMSGGAGLGGLTQEELRGMYPPPPPASTAGRDGPISPSSVRLVPTDGGSDVGPASPNAPRKRRAADGDCAVVCRADLRIDEICVGALGRGRCLRGRLGVCVATAFISPGTACVAPKLRNGRSAQRPPPRQTVHFATRPLYPPACPTTGHWASGE